MIESFILWLQQEPHRGSTTNIFLLALLLALTGIPALITMVGGAMIVVMAAFGFWRSIISKNSSETNRHLYDQLRKWAPGGIALGIAFFGLWLVSRNGDGGLMYWVGLVLFGFEAGMLSLLVHDLKREAR